MTAPLTLFDKLWTRHEIVERDGESLLWVDRHYVHEGSFHAFSRLKERGAAVAEPELTFGVADHYVPTRGRGGPIANPDIARMVSQLENNAAAQDITLFGPRDRRQGIVHVVGPELGLTLPGLLIVCGDSHTSTHGAFGAFAFGIGASEVAHVLMTQTLWQKKPKRMRITADGELARGLGAKDLALAIIAKIGADGAAGHAIEFAGSAIAALSMEGRMTLCNMAIEAGGRCGMVAPDATTFDYLEGRASSRRRALRSTKAIARLDRAEIRFRSASSTARCRSTRQPLRHSSPGGPARKTRCRSTAAIPDPACEQSPERAKYIRGAVDYMGLEPGGKLTDIVIDRVFIGSCTNARIEDLRAAAAVLAGRVSKVPGLVSPGSSSVKRQAEQEGLDRVFRDAGMEWADSGCSMCVGINGDLVAAGERCASTTNRNFRGRQGVDARTHIMSPAMVAAAAVCGHLADVRSLMAPRAK